MGRDGKKARETPEKVYAFEVWYGLAGKNFAKTREILLAPPPPPPGQAPIDAVNVTTNTLYRWADAYGWDNRAAERDILVAKQMQEDAVKARAEFLKRQTNSGRLLQKKGLAFLNNDQPVPVDPKDPKKGMKPGPGGIKSDFAALQAIRIGLELERVGNQLPDQTIGMAATHEVTIRVVRENRKPQKQKQKTEK